MKIIKFQDIDSNDICVQFSDAANIRVYVKRHDEEEITEETTCLHLTHTQAKMLVLAIQDFLEVE